MQKRLMAAWLLFVCACGAVRPMPAQGTTPPPASPTPDAPSSEVAKAIADLEERLVSALARRDRAALEPLVAPAFT